MTRPLLFGIWGLAVGGTCGADPTPGGVVTVDEAIALVLQSSPELQTLAIQENSALEGHRWGLREYLPKVGFNYAQNETVALDSPDTHSIQAGITVTQLLFDAGRGGRRRDLSRLQILTNQQDFQNEEEKLTDSVRSLFNKILVLKKKRVIEDQVIDLAETQLAIVRTERTLGSTREIDVLGTEVEVSSLLVNQRQTERSLVDAHVQLANLMGLDPSVEFDVVGDFDANYPGLVVPHSNERWLARVLDTSKDLALQRLELRKQYFDLLNAQSWFVPDVSLQTSVSLTGVTFPLQTPAYSATVTLSFPSDALPVRQTVAVGSTPGQSQNSSAATNVGILDSVEGVIDGATAEAQFRVTQVRERVLRATARYEYERTLGDYRLLVEKLALQRRTIDLEEKKNVILAKQVDLGEVKRLDYLQGETQLANDRIALIESVLQLKESERTLEQLLHLEPGTLVHAVEEEVR